MANLKTLMEKMDSMSKAAAKPTGPKFPGYWKGSDPASKAKNKMVGSAQESIVKEISQTAKDTAIKRKLENRFLEYKLREAEPVTQNDYGLPPEEVIALKRGKQSIPTRPGPASQADIDLAKRSGIADPNAIRPGQVIPGAGPGGEDYVVRPGDTLSGIRRGQYAAPGQSGISPSVQSLAQQNKLADPNKIMPGQKLTMPDGSTYTVKRGDTLYGIERQFRNRPPTDAVPTPAPAGPSTSNSRTQDLPSDDARSPDGSSGLPPSFQSSITRSAQEPGVSISPDDQDPRTRQSIIDRPSPATGGAAGGYTSVDQIRNNQISRAQPGVSISPDDQDPRTRQSISQRPAPANAPSEYDQALERSRRLQALQSVAGERGSTRPSQPSTATPAPAPAPASAPSEYDQALERSRRLQALQSVAGERGPTRPSRPSTPTPAPDPYAIDYGDAMTGMQGTPMSGSGQSSRRFGSLTRPAPVKESAWLKQLSEYKKFLEYGNAQDPNTQTTAPKTGGNPEQQKKQQEQTRDVATAKSTMSGLKNLLGPDVDTNAAASAVVKISDNEPLTGSEQQAMSALTPLIAKAAETPQVATSLKTALSTAGMLAKKGMA